MPTTVLIQSRPSSGRTQLRFNTRFDTSRAKALLSEDIHDRFGSMDVITYPGPVGIDLHQTIHHLENITEANFTFTNTALPLFDPLNEYQWTRRSTSRGATQISYQSTDDSAQSAGETQQYQDTDHHWDQDSCWNQPEDIYLKPKFDPAYFNKDAARRDWRAQKSISSDDTEGGMIPHKIKNISLQSDNTDRLLLAQTNHGQMNLEIKQEPEFKQEPEYYTRPQPQRVQYNQDPLRLDNQRDPVYDNMLAPPQSSNNNRYTPNPNQLGTQNPNYHHQRGGPRAKIDWDHHQG